MLVIIKVCGYLVSCHDANLHPSQAVPQSDGTVARASGNVVRIWMELDTLKQSVISKKE